MRTALRIAAGADDSQSVELRERAGMAMSVLTLQQFERAVRARDDASSGRNFKLRRMGRAKRNPSPSAPAMMGIASLHPSYDRSHWKREGGERANSDGPIDFVFEAHFRLNPDIAPCPFRVSRAERFRSESRMRHSCNNRCPKFRKPHR
jgi:hypothetical protein